MNSFYHYLVENYHQIIHLTLQHLQLTLMSVVIAASIGVPLGIVITRNKRVANSVLGVTGVLQAIPSLALLGFLIPLLGIGELPAIIMVILYSLLPIVKNTYVGLSGVDPSLIEASKGMGMTDRQILFKVKTPIAYPLIMAGLRISVVRAVGLMTLAAFIGAGGLGLLVYTGVQTVNTNMILAGAIPACILALLLDYIVGLIEEILTPYGIQVSMNKTKIKSRKMIKLQRKILAFVTLVILLITLIVALSSGKKKETIVIASKNFTENVTLAYMMEDIIEHDTNLNVTLKERLGATGILHDALINGDIDIYPDYTGTGYMNIMKQDITDGCDETCVYNQVKTYYNDNFDVDWLEPFGFNNTYTLAVRQDTQKKYNLKTYSDLAAVSSELVLGSTFEFLERHDGYLGLQDTYGFNFKEEKGLDEGIRYLSIINGDIDVTDAFSTDGLLIKNNLYVLKDDKKFFPPYYAAPLVRNDLIKKHPEVKTALLKLGNILDDETMSHLNYLVDVEHQSSKQVAHDYLQELGLLD